ncbi:hypothetical protein [Lactococcus lactis]|uniref:Uncharacterized protein n=1 Tax=Lactococcus lactis TaxID=1358 RepID=A0AAE4NMZ9_9LACT|nr:hypothetical protein [Lactococcus lactis]MDV2631271.1 hypothetical protein [Lactococcus lactis]PAK66288.1 hypothetical protein B8W94_11330 [Lactococcus lactis]PEN17886.1 hypothetical protein CRM88_11875 [Lactococcus lactis]
MELIFKEKCCFCLKEESLSEYTEFSEGKIYTDPDGFDFELPTWAKNKSNAKKYFKQEGWHYYKKSVFCQDCFDKLNQGYFIIDRFNQFYNDETICDTVDPSFLMNLDQARQFISATYNDEHVRFKKAFPIICQILRGEWKVDVVGHYKAHPEMTLTFISPRF